MIEMDNKSQQTLSNALESATTQDKYLETKGEIVEYYRDTHGQNWRTQFTKDWLSVLGLEDNKKNRNTASRQVQGDRAEKEARQGKTKDQWKKLGRTLPPYKAPKNLAGKSAVITTDFYVQISNSYTKKSFTRTLSPERTAQLLEEGGMDAIIEQYGINPDDCEYLDGLNISIDFV